MNRYFIDVSTLISGNFTGIANVVSMTSTWFLQNRASQTSFFLRNEIVSTAIIAKLTNAGTSAVLDRKDWEQLTTGSLESALAASRYETTVGLFGGVKPLRSVFDYEAQIIYDLTYVVVPETHHAHTVHAHGGSIEADVESNDLNICISDWTRKDLVAYVGADPEKCIVAYLGFDQTVLGIREEAEPYYLMLGTIEPRKNHALVLQAIVKHPDLLKNCKLVIAGGDGWGTSLDKMIGAFGLDHLSGTKIFKTGYCTNATRARLLRNARALLYPSLYEGFGLPVLEAMAVGTPVLTSISSSLPEVGGNAVFYTDPGSVDDFLRTLSEMEDVLSDPVRSADLHGRMRDQVKKFSWDNFCQSIANRIEADLRPNASNNERYS